MNKNEKNTLFVLGGIALLGWLLSKKRGKCPRCNYPVTEKDGLCPNCGQQLNWEGFK